MIEILIATGNRHKADEIRAIFADKRVRLYDLSRFPGTKEPLEDGATFRANAELKARYYHSQTGMPVMADDSGLVVPVLGGEPGIYSARYAGPGSDYPRNNRKLLARLAGVPEGQRSAWFICSAVYWDGADLISAEGRIDGRIGYTVRGGNGFGYDPLFLIDGTDRTLAELSAAEKNRISHRYRAFTQLRAELGRVKPDFNIDRQVNNF